MPSIPTPQPVDQAAIERSILDKLIYTVGKDPAHAVTRDWCVALSLAVRDRVVDGWMPATRRTYETGQKRVYYLSMEFLIGRLLRDSMTNLGLSDACAGAMANLGQDMSEVLEAEPDAALGNGGLGRLAACFLDSMSTLGIAGNGYGIRYHHGLFRQTFDDGWQSEHAEDWLVQGHPWEFERPEVVYPIGFGGEVAAGDSGTATWRPAERIMAAAYDTPIAGWQGRHVNTLRLWDARPSELFDLARFNEGDFIQAASGRVLAETISRVLYPNDATPAGRALRLRQEFFFTSASIQDLLRRFLQDHDDIQALPRHVAIQLNDTHPAIAVPELMRLLVDEHGQDRKSALNITRASVAYTNHTLMPEALESWPLDLMGEILPRQLQMIEWLQAEVAEAVSRNKTSVSLDSVSPIRDGSARMGHIAFLGSHRINGVSALHTELMKETVFRDLHALHPERILNQTNGITPRRWLLECNPALAALVTESIGGGWVTELERLEGLASMAEDGGFKQRFAGIKRDNKAKLADVIREQLGLVVNPDAMFDVQIKRIHEYKRQLMNILEAIAHYQAIRENPDAGWQPRVRIFGGKAAPSYERAKLIIKLINDAAAVINADPVVGDRLKIAFLPNYNVSLAEQIIPATDLSEQISTAGMEASGTGNMKFALNGALTIGTLDGANVEIKERVGDDNIVIFGLTADQVAAERARGYDPSAAIAQSPALNAVIQAIEAGLFSPDQPDRFSAITDDLRRHDYFMVAADFDAYADAQRKVDRTFGDQAAWWRKAILNTANVGWFSSDRTIKGYATEIWNAMP